MFTHQEGCLLLDVKHKPTLICHSACVCVSDPASFNKEIDYLNYNLCEQTRQFACNRIGTRRTYVRSTQFMGVLLKSDLLLILLFLDCCIFLFQTRC